MKKRKILVLFPFLGLLLSGCSVEGVMAKAKDLLSQYIYQPIKGLIDGGSKEDDSGKDKPAEKTLSSIAVTKHPEKVKVGEAIDKNEVKLTLTYSDESKEENVAAEEVVCDTSKAAKGVEATAKYKDKTATFKIDVVEDKPSVNPEHAGTEQDPYSSADAVLVASALSKGEATEASYYIKGEVESFEEAFNAQYGNYSFKLKDGFIGWRLKYGPNYAKFNEGDLEVGDTVTLYAQIQAFGDELKPETKGGYITKIEKKAIDAKLESISIEGEPTKEYLAGTAYNHDGLKVVGHYDNGQTQDLSLGATWGISKEKAEVGDESITISATYGDFKASLVVPVTVQDSSKPQHAGTAEDPYTGLDAVIVASKLEESTDPAAKKPTEDSFYIKDTVKSIIEFSAQYGNYTFMLNGDFEGFRLKNGPEKVEFISDKDIEVGDVVTIYAQILNWKGTYETEGGYVVSIEKSTANVITGLVENSAEGISESIMQGTSLDKTKITVEATYKDGHTGKVNPDDIELDTSVPGKNIEGKLIVGEFEYVFTIEVLKKEVPAGEVHDVLNLEFTGVSGTTYTDWSGKTGTSGAVYAGQSAGSNNSIQLRSKNENSGIVSTVSGGKLLKVLIDWNENTVDGRTLDIYGKNTAYTSPTELYGENAGELIGSAAKGTTEVTIEGEFEYVGVRSNKDALYLNSITFVYAEAAPAVEVTSVEVAPKNLELDVSDNPAQLSATVLPENATDPSVTWSSSDETVAKVSAEGLVTPVASGNATIIAKAGEKEDKCEVKVTTKVQGVSITPTLNLVEGNTGKVVVEVLPVNADDASYTLVSSDPEVAKVEANGDVTAVKAGTATITAKTTDGEKTAQCVVTVSELAIPVTSVELVGFAEEIEMTVGEELELKAQGMPENATEDRSVEWALQDSESEILAVYSTGKIVALKEGTVTVRAISVVNNEAYKDVTVKVSKLAVESVGLNKEELTLTVGAEETLVATVSPEGATYPEVSWKSSDEEIAKVDDDGVVTGIAVGEATITAEADGKSATCVVTVEEAVVVNTVELAYKGAMDGSTDAFTFSGTVVSMSKNSYVLQDGEYAINIYTAPAEGVELGKLVEIVSTVKLYQGCPQTNSISSVVVKGEGTPQISAPVTSKEGLDALNHSVLAHVDDAIFVSKNGDWGSNSTKQFVFEIGGDNITVSFDKQGYDADKAAIANAAVVGEHFKFTGLVTGAYSGNNQLTFTGTSGIEKTQDAPVPDPTSVTITSGDSLAVGSDMTLTATVGPAGAAQDVKWTITSGADYATLSDGVLTGVAAGDVTVRATAVGYENVYAEKTITVSSTGPAVKYATKVTSASEIVSGAKYYIGYENGGNSFVFSGVDGTSDYESVAVTENGIEQKESLICVEITAIEGGYSLKVVGSANDGKYMRGTKDKNDLKFESTEQLNTISISDGLATIISNTSELVFNNTSGQTRFRYYKPATVSGNPSVYLRPCIYMLAE